MRTLNLNFLLSFFIKKPDELYFSDEYNDLTIASINTIWDNEKSVWDDL